MSQTGQEDWREVADALREHGQVPKRRAQCAALRAQGMSYQAISDELGLGSRSNARKHVLAFVEQREAAGWLAEHGPAEDELSK